jgi:hypothetical protein
MAGEDAGDAVSGNLTLLFGADDHDPHGLPPDGGPQASRNGAGDDSLAGELPGGAEPPPGLPVEPAENDRCIGASGVDTAVDCDRTIGVEG